MKTNLNRVKALLVMCISVLLAHYSNSQTVYYISTIAGTTSGGYSGDGGQATAAKLNGPGQIMLDGSGDLYIADVGNARVRKVNTSGVISTIAGNGTVSFSGDGGAATAAEFHFPWGVAMDASGDIIIADVFNDRIREINTSGTISTIAGTGFGSPTSGGYSGDGAAATAAELFQPEGLAIDGSGNIYFADYANNRIREINTSGVISTIAGNGTAGYSGDGSAATAAKLRNPTGVSFDQSGNLYIADGGNSAVREVNTSGTISTIAGNGTLGYTGDGSAATAAEISIEGNVAVDNLGDVFIPDYHSNRIRMINTSGVISTIAGNGTAGFAGDGGLASAAEFDQPDYIIIDGSGDLYISDSFVNNRIRKLTPFTVSMAQTGNGKCGLNQGAATATPSGGVSAYSYSWAPTGYTGGTTATYSNLPNGTYTVTVTDANGAQATNSLFIHCNHEAIRQVSDNSDLKIYPNPTAGLFTIEGTSKGSVIKIYNELGANIKTVNVDKAETQIIDVSTMPDGIYFISVNNADGSIESQQKIMKTH